MTNDERDPWIDIIEALLDVTMPRPDEPLSADEETALDILLQIDGGE